MQTEFPSLQNLARRLLALEADPNFEALRTSQSRTNMFRIVGTTDRERCVLPANLRSAQKSAAA